MLSVSKVLQQTNGKILIYVILSKFFKCETNFQELAIIENKLACNLKAQKRSNR